MPKRSPKHPKGGKIRSISGILGNSEKRNPSHAIFNFLCSWGAHFQYFRVIFPNLKFGIVFLCVLYEFPVPLKSPWAPKSQVSAKWVPSECPQKPKWAPPEQPMSAIISTLSLLKPPLRFRYVSVTFSLRFRDVSVTFSTQFGSILAGVGPFQ